ncbi:TetR/AcrR family transcriptional regulator [Paenibacillus silviterrae]|uniref:TetR/AcrR family transcriptional regulator n=1 Tax=Paenibacillus silviterrae TaxID=3242194 RepID=UPI00254382BF|nr:TetR/AcrR family transcriptional regulator [Paenibacillus chinjuensis]
MAKPNVITKLDLLSAAQQCMSDKGLEQITLKAVAEQAGVSQGTVYYHFRTKEQLLIELVEHLCDSSWEAMQAGGITLEEVLQSAQSRCSYDSVYHRLFFTALASGLHMESSRRSLSDLLAKENRHLTGILSSAWKQSPVEGMSLEQWGMLMNAMIDGLAVQALLDKEFPQQELFEALRHLLHDLGGRVK